MSSANDKRTESIPDDGVGEASGALRLDLRPGHDVQLQAAGSNSRIVSRYVGQHAGRYLIFRGGRRMEDNLQHMHFSAGEWVLARMVQDGTVLGFRARILIQHRTPEHLLYLEWPAEVAEHSIRAAPRIPCLAGCGLTIDGTRHDGALLDVSETGCRVDLLGLDEDALGAQNRVAVSLHLPGQPGPVEISATVRRSKVAGGRLLLGLQFEEPQRELMSEVRRYLQDVD